MSYIPPPLFLPYSPASSPGAVNAGDSAASAADPPASETAAASFPPAGVSALPASHGDVAASVFFPDDGAFLETELGLSLAPVGPDMVDPFTALVESLSGTPLAAEIGVGDEWRFLVSI